VTVSANTLLLPVGLALAVVNYAWIGMLLAIVCARFRDVIQLVTNMTTVLFFVTPIFWQPEQLQAAPMARFILADANPAYHIVDVIRAPLLGQVPELLSFIYLGTSAVLGFVLISLFLRPFYNRIAYWL
jgi:lipopolysaccharide transport system permease protein